MTAVCVIPARAGSKGVPRKNLREVAGKPLIVWTIEQALAVTTPLEVVVSTDDDEIASVARDAGASVPFLRPPELAQDTTATEPVVRHALASLDRLGTQASTVLLLQATSPVRLPGTLDRALSEFTSTGVDSMVGVVPRRRSCGGPVTRPTIHRGPTTRSMPARAARTSPPRRFATVKPGPSTSPSGGCTTISTTASAVGSVCS